MLPAPERSASWLQSLHVVLGFALTLGRSVVILPPLHLGFLHFGCVPRFHTCPKVHKDSTCITGADSRSESPDCARLAVRHADLNSYATPRLILPLTATLCTVECSMTSEEATKESCWSTIHHPSPQGQWGITLPPTFHTWTDVKLTYGFGILYNRMRLTRPLSMAQASKKRLISIAAVGQSLLSQGSMSLTLAA